MANKKQEAKDFIENKISNLFGSDYIASTGGKIYVWGKTKSGEKMQVALSMTIPSTPIEVPDVVNTGFDWTDSPTLETKTEQPNVQSDAEKENIAVLLASLGL